MAALEVEEVSQCGRQATRQGGLEGMLDLFLAQTRLVKLLAGRVNRGGPRSMEVIECGHQLVPGFVTPLSQYFSRV